MLEKSDFLLIIPTFNEALNVEVLFKNLSILRQSGTLFEVLLIDDGSPDYTAEIVRKFGLNWVTILSNNEKKGLGTAYKQGFLFASELNYKFVVEMDADGSHKVEDLKKLLGADHSYELVIGSRWVPGGEVVNWPVHRILISRIGNIYAKILLGIKVNDSTSGFRRIGVTRLRQIDLNKISSAGYGFQVEIAHLLVAHGAKYLEIPISFVERVHGKSKMSKEIALEAFKMVTFMGLKRIILGISSFNKGNK